MGSRRSQRLGLWSPCPSGYRLSQHQHQKCQITLTLKHQADRPGSEVSSITSSYENQLLNESLHSGGRWTEHVPRAAPRIRHQNQCKGPRTQALAQWMHTQAEPTAQHPDVMSLGRREALTCAHLNTRRETAEGSDNLHGPVLSRSLHKHGSLMTCKVPSDTELLKFSRTRPGWPGTECRYYWQKDAYRNTDFVT